MIVLLLDDDLDDIEIFTEAVSQLRADITLLKFHNPDEALHALQIVHPQYVFIDLNMPKMNGVEFLRRYDDIKTTRPLKTILLSTNINKENAAAAAQFQAECWIKPNTIGELATMLAQLFVG